VAHCGQRSDLVNVGVLIETNLVKGTEREREEERDITKSFAKG